MQVHGQHSKNTWHIARDGVTRAKALYTLPRLPKSGGVGLVLLSPGGVILRATSWNR